MSLAATKDQLVLKPIYLINFEKIVILVRRQLLALEQRKVAQS